MRWQSRTSLRRILYSFSRISDWQRRLNRTDENTLDLQMDYNATRDNSPQDHDFAVIGALQRLQMLFIPQFRRNASVENEVAKHEYTSHSVMFHAQTAAYSLDQIQRFAEHGERRVLFGGTLQRRAGQQKVQDRFQILHRLREVIFRGVGRMLERLRLEQQLRRIATVPGKDAN